jgi:ABC-type multidrug transport system ATPase subunit/ABC-type transport system involved in multi-copper enzyme maturation permease subunit
MIEVAHLRKQYGARTALDNVSLLIRPGEVTWLLGPNGAGKSTLLRCLLGIEPFEGRIRVSGLDPIDQGPAVRALVGYMPQAGGLHHDLTVEQTMRFYAAVRQAPWARASALLSEAGLDDHRGAPVGELSGGLKQRLGFAIALLADPPVLVLDEPSASLDAASREWLSARLAEMAAAGRTVIVSTHGGQALQADHARRIMLEGGRVIGDERRAAPAGAADAAGPTALRRRTGAVLPIARKELRDAVRNRWVAGYAVLLGLLGLAAAATGIEGSSGLALQAYGRTTATLMNLCLLLSPLVAVLLGASAIAGERDRGTLEHLLAQPVTRAGLLLGKHAGLVVALSAATLVGFLPAGVLVAARAGGLSGQYLLFPVIAGAAGAAMLAIGLLISVSSRTGVQAQGAGVFAWFAFVLLYDLILMGSLASTGLRVELVAASLAANPIDAARVLGVLTLEPDLYLLGPAGAYLVAELTRAGTALVLVAALAAWAVLPLAAALVRFRVRRPHGARAPAAVKRGAREASCES